MLNLNDVNLLKILKNNGVGVMPTDTVYGLVGLLSSQIAVERIYSIKNRPASKPIGTVLIANSAQLADMVNENFLEKAKAYWPGPTSVILPLGKELNYAHKKLMSLPFRIPADEVLIKFLEKTGPLATSSANISGQAPVVNITEAQYQFGNEVDFYVDGGDMSNRVASSIIQFLPNGEVNKIR